MEKHGKNKNKQNIAMSSQLFSSDPCMSVNFWSRSQFGKLRQQKPNYQIANV